MRPLLFSFVKLKTEGSEAMFDLNSELKRSVGHFFFLRSNEFGNEQKGEIFKMVKNVAARCNQDFRRDLLREKRKNVLCSEMQI
jgi:hypothetical protein